jgi:site-specific recombinase XerD
MSAVGAAAVATTDWEHFDRRAHGANGEWAAVAKRAPKIVATVRGYLDELAVTMAAGSVVSYESHLRDFVIWLAESDPTCRRVAAVTANHIADYRAWLQTRPARQQDRPVSERTIEQRLAVLRLFFERIAARGWADSPRVNPIPRVPRSRVRPKPPPGPRKPGGGIPEITWNDIAASAPQLAATMGAYLDQLAVSARPATVNAVSLALRFFAGHLIRHEPDCAAVADVERRHIESYKVALAARRTRSGRPLANETIRGRLSLLRTFFERVIEWDYLDAPPRMPIYAVDVPRADEPPPKFLDDPTAAKFMATLATDTDRRRRLMVELLARTGMRAGELATLRDDAMFRLGEHHWLRIEVGKLHNGRTVPLHPLLVGLISDYRAERGPSATGLLVERRSHTPFDRRTIHRYVASVARRAGIGHVHPHQLRHTLATQCINRGMSLEAVAALLGHRSPKMTGVYARISSEVVAEQYFAAMAAMETQPQRTALPTTNMATTSPHRRLLGNGHCTRPVELDCRFQTMCEGCGFFETSEEFVPILRRQHHNAVEHNDLPRAKIFHELVTFIASDHPAKRP